MVFDLLSYLRRFERRLRLRDGWLAGQRTLWLALLATVLVLAAARIWPIPGWLRLALLPPALWLAAVLGWALLRPLPPMRVARQVDRELNLKERLSTSLALEGGGERPLPEAVRASFTPELVGKQNADALAAASQVQPGRDFPLRWLRRPLLAALGLVVAAALLAVLPNPMDGVLAEREAVRQAAQEQAQRVDELKNEVEQNQELTAEEREELLKRLEELAKQLRENPGDREKALADLSKAEQALRERLQPDAAARQAAMEALADQLRQLSGEQSQRQPGDVSSASQDLQKLAEQLATLNPEQREALAQELSTLAARAGQAGLSDLAQALSQMAQAAQNGDAQQANQAAQNAAQALRQAQSQQAAQAEVQRALSQLQSGRQAVSQAGQPGDNRAQSGQGQQPGQGQGSQGQGNQGQQAGSGQGSNANSLPPNQGNAGQVRPPQGSRPGQAGEDLSNQVYVPREEGGKEGEMFVPGQDTGQGTIEENQSKDPLAGGLNPALVPYHQVYQQYLDAANQTIEQSYIPAGMKDYIRAYFESLGQ